jgi:phage N-6-adenine-methyltransferase
MMEAATKTSIGHNSALMLELIANDALHGLSIVADGEGRAVEGWLIYGAALNEGRKLFRSDELFGKWVKGNLPDTEQKEREAAMWAADDPLDFKATQEANTNTKTVRGWHSKWKDAENARLAEEARIAAVEANRLAKAKANAEAEAKAEVEAAENAKAKAAAEKKAKLATEERERADAEAKEAKAAAKKAKDKKTKARKPHVENNTGNNEWYTPSNIIEAARGVLGGFDLDPASSEIANQTVKADCFLTEEDDGLAGDWPVCRIWMNPPYAQPLMGQFAAKYAESITAGSTGIVLVNNATETAWFQELLSVSSAVCFHKGRVKFLDSDGKPGAPLQGQAIIYAGDDVDKFEAAFKQFGVVLRNG